MLYEELALYSLCAQFIARTLTGFETELEYSLADTEFFYLKYGWRLPFYLTFVAYCPASFEVSYLILMRAYLLILVLINSVAWLTH